MANPIVKKINKLIAEYKLLTTEIKSISKGVVGTGFNPSDSSETRGRILPCDVNPESRNQYIEAMGRRAKIRAEIGCMENKDAKKIFWEAV